LLLYNPNLIEAKEKPMQPKIMQFKLPPEFFSKVLSDYRDWKYAWVREVLQNSIDANSSEIDFKVEIISDLLVSVTIKDNGSGMNRDVLENGFMSLGGSVKENADSVGGFGVASMMIAQSHDSYTIRSHDYVCTGSKGVYQITDSDTFTKGCEITVIFNKKDVSLYASPLAVMLDNLKRWCSYADVKNVLITFNGDNISPKCETFEYKVDTELGMLSFSDNDQNNDCSTLYVRLNKQPMFPVSIYSDNGASFKGVLDLNGSSKENLTSNRDGLLGCKNDVISTIIKELSNERSKFKLGNMNDFKLNEMDVSNAFLNMNEEDIQELEKAFKTQKENNDNDDDDDDVRQNDRNGKPYLRNIFDKEKNRFESLKDRISAKIDKIKGDKYPLNFNIKYDTNKEESLTKRLTFLIKVLNQAKFQKLAWQWKFITDSLLSCLVERQPFYFTKKGDFYFYNNKVINVGFVFNNEAEGVCSQNDKEINILVNPDIAKDFDFCCIKDVAIHEVTHIDIPNHGDYFSAQEIAVRRAWRKKYKASQFKKDMQEFYLKKYK
jgi:hypothetical protein